MISILLPIYNGVQYFYDSFNSILNQTFQEWELLIGVNGHQENSEVLKTVQIIVNNLSKNSKNNIQIFDFHQIKGKGKTLNELAKNCKYNWIALIDVDDIWFPAKLEKQLPFLEKFDVIGGKCTYIQDSKDTPILPVGDISNFDFKSKNPIINSSVILRKELANWSDHFIEDYKLWLELKRDDKKFYNVNEVIVYHRIHKDSFFNNKNIVYLEDLLKQF